MRTLLMTALICLCATGMSPSVDEASMLFFVGNSRTQAMLQDVKLLMVSDGKPIAEITGYPFTGTPPLGTFTFRLLSVTDILSGDANGDGSVNGLDVGPFVDAIVHGPFGQQPLRYVRPARRQTPLTGRQMDVGKFGHRHYVRMADPYVPFHKWLLDLIYTYIRWHPGRQCSQSL